MDLALSLGMPVAALSRMSERELRQWSGYASKRMLPQRRLEVQLAQIALLIAQTMGGAEGVTIKDFLFDPPPTEDEQDAEVTDEDVDALKEAIGFNPV